MGNAGGTHRSGGTHGDVSDSTFRNPLRRGSDMSTTPNSSVLRGERNCCDLYARGGSKHFGHPCSNHNHSDSDPGNVSANFAVPQPPPLPTCGVGNGGGSFRSRQLQVSWSNKEDLPTQSLHRSTALSCLSNAGSIDSDESIVSRASTSSGKTRLALSEAREILLSTFSPRQGRLECVTSGFITAEHYALMRGFWAPFLTSELRDRWYLDAVMLSVLGKDFWRTVHHKEAIMSTALSRDQLSLFDRQRQEYSDQLRERLLDLCGALVESRRPCEQKTKLQFLVQRYQRHKGANPNNVAGVGGTSTSKASFSTPHQQLLNLSFVRLQTTVSTSFDCFDLLASRIPTSVVSSLPITYFLNTTPVVYTAIAYQETKVGDLETMSFFVTLESRRRLLNGRTSNSTRRFTRANSDNHGLEHLPSVYDATGPGGTIDSVRQFYSAVCHAGMVLTTACSSMVLTVMFQLAEVLRARQVFRDNKAKADEQRIPLEQLIGRDEAAVRTYSGKPTDDMEELKQYAIRDEMSLAVLTPLLIENFRKENRAKIDKLRTRYPNLFAPLEAIAPPEEQEDFDASRLLSGIVLKLMFLTGGGQRSITADDQRVPGGVSKTTDDIAISKMLEVPILSRICWVACMMGMPIMSNHGILAQKHQGKPLIYMELDECCGVMRRLFQAVGALPCGNACPHGFKEWFPLFPFYAVNVEGKRVLMYLYAAQVSPIQRVPLTILKDLTLLSFSTALQDGTGKSRVDIANYFFDATLTVGDTGRSKDGESSPGTPPSVVSTSASEAASPFAPKSVASAISASGSTAVKAWRASASPRGEGQSNASPRAAATFQHMTAVDVGKSTSMALTKTSLSNMADHSAVPRQNPRLDDESSSTSSSCSTLLEDDRDIDVYTCVNTQMQLYMRCSNEATRKRHGVTELTPSVSVTYLHSQHATQSKRPDIAPALHQAVPKLMPSEGFLVVRWTTAAPLVTFRAGDVVSAMAEPTTSLPHKAGSSKNNGGEFISSPDGGQPRCDRARYFTGATRPHPDDGALETADVLHATGMIRDDNHTRAPTSSPRGHTVTIGDCVARGNSSKTAGLSLSDHKGGMSPSGHARSSSSHNSYDITFTGYDGIDGNAASSPTNTHGALEATQMFEALMHDFLTVKAEANRRLAMRWNVIEVLPSSHLMQQSRSMSSTINSGGQLADYGSKQQHRYEVVLHVAAPEMPVSMPLKILTIGHERASMSIFTYLNCDDSVCWANPRLVEAIVRRGRGSTGNDNAGRGLLRLSETSKRPDGVLCNTKEELHNVFFSIGVLLSNAIVNGVYLNVPIAPLVFFMIKKALSSGDYSFKSFLWLEPADGNLLSPALVMNSAYEILTMSEQQYVAFLQSRGMASGDACVFPVMHSLLDEMREEKMCQSTGTLSASEECRPPPSLSPARRQRSSGGFSDTSARAMSSHTRVRSSTSSHTPLGIHEYTKVIQLHNRRGTSFQRSQCYSFGAAGGAAGASVHDHPQGVRAQQQNGGQLATCHSLNTEPLYAKLPSRREYLYLYLVNDLTWGSARCGGIGEKNKELLVSMARGFMTSAVAKSPLMTNCCSRMIREVLCVPRSDGRE